MIKAALLIAKKDMLQVWRDKRSLALVLMPILIFPVLNIGYKYISTYFEKSAVDIAVVDEVRTEESADIVSAIAEKYTLKEVGGEAPLDLLRKDELTAVIIIKKDCSIKIYQNASIGSMSLSQTIYEFLDNYLESVLKEKISDLRLENLVNTFDVSVESLNNDKDIISQTTILIPAVLLISIMFQGVIGYSADVFAGEKERKTLELILLSKIDKKAIVFGKTLVLLFIGLLNFFVSLLAYVISMPLSGSLSALRGFSFGSFAVAVLCLLSVLVFSVSLFNLISMVSKSIKQAQLTSEILSFVPSGIGFFIVFSNSGSSKIATALIPFYGVVKAYVSAFQGNMSFVYCLVAVASCLLAAVLILWTSFVYIDKANLVE